MSVYKLLKWQLSLLNIHAADTVRKHIMLSIRKPDLSVLDMQKIIDINSCQYTIKSNCKKIARQGQTPDDGFFFFSFFLSRVPLRETARKLILGEFPAYDLFNSEFIRT